MYELVKIAGINRGDIMLKYKILWLVTARAGSKSVANKNVKLLGGIPLLAYRIKSVQSIADKSDIWISTDSSEYAKIANEYGAEVPFIRPKHLATDEAKSSDVVLHAMEYAESKGCKYDAVALLEPTSPFIKTQQLCEAVARLFSDSKADSVVAVREIRPSTFYIQKEEEYLTQIAKNINSMGVLRRQEEKREITPCGGFYISKWDNFKKNKSFYTEKTLSYLVPDIDGLEIDEPIDWLWAEFLINKNIGI